MNSIESRQSVPGALIVGGAHVSIGLARSLGRRRIPVWLLADHPLPKFSRYVGRSFPWPEGDEEQNVSSIIDIAVQHGLRGWVLIAAGDENMRLIAQNHALLVRHFCLTTANWDVMQWVYDKRLTYRQAASLHIDCAWNFQPSNFDEVQHLNCAFPVVLKPACRTELNEFTRAKAWKANDRNALLSLYQRAAALVGDDGVIIQEWIPGNGESQFSYAGLWNRGAPVASLVARRTRQYPIDFGRSSTFVETVTQEEIETLAGRFLKSINYSGIVEMEFKHDRRDLNYKLLDVNGRFWTWHSLGQLAGVDFPYLAWRLATGQSIPSTRAETGVAWMHASRDIIAAWKEISHGTLTVPEYLASFRRKLAFASFALDDPLPAIVELPIVAARYIIHKRAKHSASLLKSSSTVR